MKNEQLKRLIKEEIKNILKENPTLSGGGDSADILPNTVKPGQEKISSGDFNAQLIAFVRDLKKEQSKIMGAEKQNLLDLFDLLVRKANEGTLTQTMEDRIIRILMLKDPETPKV